jgi:hypothetical protein
MVSGSDLAKFMVCSIKIGIISVIAPPATTKVIANVTTAPRARLSPGNLRAKNSTGRFKTSVKNIAVKIITIAQRAANTAKAKMAINKTISQNRTIVLVEICTSVPFIPLV